MSRVGFCCILKSKEKNNEYKVNRRFNTYQKFLDDKNSNYSLLETTSKLLENIKGTRNIIQHCIDNNIGLYRMSSGIIPNIGEYSLSEVHNFDYVKSKLVELGRLIIDSGIRVSFHPDHFVKLATDNEELLSKSIKILEVHHEFMELCGLPANRYYHINIHVGGAYGNKQKTLTTLTNNLLTKVNKKILNRLTFENDDKKSMYTVKDLYDHVYKKTNVSIVFDSFHHSIHNTNIDGSKLSYNDAIKYFVNSWENTNINPLAHHSSSKNLHETKAKDVAHADYLYEKFDNQGNNIDIELEAKAKDLALNKYIKDYM